MHPDLQAIIDRAVRGYDALMGGQIEVKQANAVIGFNQNIISAHAIDLRERIFFHEQKAYIEEAQRKAGGASPPVLEGVVEATSPKERLG